METGRRWKVAEGAATGDRVNVVTALPSLARGCMWLALDY